MSRSSPLDRRTLLRRSLQIGTTVAGAVLAATALGEGDVVTRHPTATTTTTLGPPTTSAWTRLSASLSGTLIRPDDAAYTNDTLLYNAKFVNLHPQAIAYCASADDVARCVDFATSHEIAMAARSGGHSYGGYSSCSGLVIDVSRLSSISVDTTTNVATVGAGAALIDVYNALGRHGRLLPGGSCPTVGIAGLALGGGVGVFSRRYGLTCDNLRALQLVTSDAHEITASAEHHADLLWASRGGGGGNYGVATSFEFTVHPLPEITLFEWRYPWSAASAMLEAWLPWAASAPDELWSNCQLLSQGGYGFLAQVSGVYCGPPSTLDGLLAGLERAAPPPSERFVGSSEYLAAMAVEAGCAALSVAACHLHSRNPHGALHRSAYSAKSSYVDRPMTSERAAAMVAAVARLGRDAPSVGGGLALDAYGGAINAVAPQATAFVHRDALACIQATYSWSTWTAPRERRAGERWLAWLGADVFDPTTGAYQNYIDPTLVSWPTAYYGSNLERLMAVKGRYDPQNHFAFAQSIPVAARGSSRA